MLNVLLHFSAVSDYLTVILLGILCLFVAVIQFSNKSIAVTKRFLFNAALIVFAPYTIGFLLKIISKASLASLGSSLVLMFFSSVGIIIILSIIYWGLGDLTIYNADQQSLLDIMRGILREKGIAFTEREDSRLSSIAKQVQSKGKHHFDLTELASSIVVVFEHVPKVAIIRVTKRKYFPDCNDVMLNIRSAANVTLSNSNSAGDGVFFIIIALSLIVTGFYCMFFR